MKDEDDKGTVDFDFGGHITHLEDAQSMPMPSDKKTYSNEQLEAAGLVKTSAFIRTRRSKNALRSEKAKEKKAEEGIKQLNVQIPENQAEPVKHLAKQLREGAVIDFTAITSPDPKVATYGQQCVAIERRGGIKSVLLRLLLGRQAGGE